MQIKKGNEEHREDNYEKRKTRNQRHMPILWHCTDRGQG